MNLTALRQYRIGALSLSTKFWRTMRLITAFMLIGSLHVSASSYSQTVTLSARKISLARVFKAIEKQAGYGFFYDAGLLKGAPPVTIDVEKAPVELVLNEVLKNRGLSYSIENRTITLMRRVELPELPAAVAAADSSIIVKGKVADKKGVALPGVSVLEKGTSNGTVTNENGEFSLKVKSPSAALVLKYIGYETIEAAVREGAMNITLNESESDLGEVVVVGYGTQKKVDLTGSVATVNSKEIENRSVTNVSSSLAGLAPGVAVRQSSGRPGSDGASIRIRGQGTLNNNDALVLIDGIIGSMDAVNPNDVESISILKDAASASIYGSLAANGVILITTKKGKTGKPQMSYSSVLSITQPTNLPTFVSDYVRHMNLYNEAARNLGQSPVYSQASIDKWTEANKDPNAVNEFGIPNYVAYPNTDWGSEIFEKNIVQNHNLSVMGGSEYVNYNVSTRILNNPGLMHNTGLKRYELRANLEVKVTDFLTLGTQTFGLLQNRQKGNTDNTFNFLRQTTPGLYPLYEGRFGAPSSPDESAGLNNLLVHLYGNGGNEQTSRFNSTVYAKLNIWKGLQLESKINYQMNQFDGTSYSIPLDRWDFSKNIIIVPAGLPNTLGTSFDYNKNYKLTFDNVLRYNTVINKDHSIGALVGYNEYALHYKDVSASKRGLIDATVTTLSSATEMVSTTGGGYDYAYRSYFGRVNYGYKEKYLVEANLRYDGVSRFAENNRWGTFPSFSAGWRLSEEPFLKNINRVFQNLKLRASWGKLGNSNIGNYDYMATYGGVNYAFNNAPVIGLAQSKYANADLSWEETTQTDVGLDFSMLHSRLSVEMDYYSRYTDGILTVPPIYLTAGTQAGPTRNTAAVLNRGLEVAVNWRDNKGDFNYSVGANFAYNYNVVDKYKGALKEGWSKNGSGQDVYTSNIGDVSSGGLERIVEGYGINTYYLRNLYSGSGTYFNADGSVNINGGPQSGMIRTPEDLAWVNAMKAAGYSFSPVNTVGKAQLYYGDFIFADRNGDGVYGNTFDQYLTNIRTEPKYIFGLNLSAEYKGIDLSMIWAGMAGMQYYWNAEGYNNSILRNGNATGTRMADDHYYYNADNPDDPGNNINGRFPRLKFNSDAINNTANIFWMDNAAWVRLKNAQIGYTLPRQWTDRLRIAKARVYFTGENLLTFTAFPGLDPELGPNVGYPTMQQYALGLNVNF